MGILPEDMGYKLFNLYLSVCLSPCMSRMYNKVPSSVSHDRLEEVELKDAKKKGEN